MSKEQTVGKLIKEKNVLMNGEVFKWKITLYGERFDFYRTKKEALVDAAEYGIKLV